MERTARGNTAEVFVWDEDTVLKLWIAPDSSRDVEHEAGIVRTLTAAGLDVPEVLDVIVHDGRPGILYRRVRGVPMLAWMFTETDGISAAAERLGQLHADLHQVPAVRGLPMHRPRIRQCIANSMPLAPTERRKMLSVLEQLPDGAFVCHGDFHPGNVMVDGQRFKVIDWLDATSGPSVADVARTLLLIDFATVDDATRSDFRSRYLESYRQYAPLDDGLLHAWYPVIAAARLVERIDSERDRLVAVVRRSLEQA